MTRKVFNAIVVFILFLGSMAAYSAEPTAPIRIACVGDSITWGYKVSNRERMTFPAQLGTMLGTRYEVKNFGKNGATLLKKGDLPYWELSLFKKAQDYTPDIVIIKLGTNDSKGKNWKHKAEFKANYIEMVKIFQSLDNKPTVWVCYPAPAFSTKFGIRGETIEREIIPLIDDVAKETGAKVIDLYKPLSDKPNLFADTIHPSAKGATVLAKTIFEAISGKTSEKAEEQ